MCLTSTIPVFSCCKMSIQRCTLESWLSFSILVCGGGRQWFILTAVSCTGRQWSKPSGIPSVKAIRVQLKHRAFKSTQEKLRSENLCSLDHLSGLRACVCVCECVSVVEGWICKTIFADSVHACVSVGPACHLFCSCARRILSFCD